MKRLALVILITIVIIISSGIVLAACANTGYTTVACNSCPGESFCIPCCIPRQECDPGGGNGNGNGNDPFTFAVADPTGMPVGGGNCWWVYDNKQCSAVADANCEACGCGASTGGKCTDTPGQTCESGSTCPSGMEPASGTCDTGICCKPSTKKTVSISFGVESAVYDSTKTYVYDIGAYLAEQGIARNCVTKIEIKNIKVDDQAWIYYQNSDGSRAIIDSFLDYGCKGFDCGRKNKKANLCKNCGFLRGTEDWCETCSPCNGNPFTENCGDYNADPKICQKCHDYGQQQSHACEICYSPDDGKPLCESYFSLEALTPRGSMVLAEVGTGGNADFEDILYNYAYDVKLVIDVKNKCHNTALKISFDVEISRIFSDAFGKGSQCLRGELKPYCNAFKDGDVVPDSPQCGAWQYPLDYPDVLSTDHEYGYLVKRLKDPATLASGDIYRWVKNTTASAGFLTRYPHLDEPQPYVCETCHCLYDESADDDNACYDFNPATDFQRACLSVSTDMKPSEHIPLTETQIGSGDTAYVFVEKNRYFTKCAAPIDDNGPWVLKCGEPTWETYCKINPPDDYRTGCVPYSDSEDAIRTFIPSKRDVALVIAVDEKTINDERYIDFRKTSIKSSCKYGCNNGVCNPNTAPELYSIETDLRSPAYIKAGDPITVTSSGYSGDTDQRIRLICTDIETKNTKLGGVDMTPGSGCPLGNIYNPSQQAIDLGLDCIANYDLHTTVKRPHGGTAANNCICLGAPVGEGKCPYGSLFYTDRNDCPENYQHISHDGLDKDGHDDWADSCKCEEDIWMADRTVEIDGVDVPVHDKSCSGDFADENPTCTISSVITSEWEDGEKTIYCRVKDGGGGYSTWKSFDVTVDNESPIVEILSPDARGVDVPELTQDFTVVVKDEDAEYGMAITPAATTSTCSGSGYTCRDDCLKGELTIDEYSDLCDTGEQCCRQSSCEYNVYSNGVKTRNWTVRACNSGFLAAIGSERDCGIGVCKVEVMGFDLAGNNATDEREFDVNYIFSRVVEPDPERGGWFGANFSVWVEDTDNSGIGFDLYTAEDGTETSGLCEYRVWNAVDWSTDWIERDCNSNFTVSVGTDGVCTEEGESVCWIHIRAKNALDESGLSASYAYNISWSVPITTIISPSFDVWQTSDFAVEVSDVENLGIGFERCDYRVFNNGILSKDWTERQCDTSFTLTVGENGDCYSEGAGACNITVRSKSGGMYSRLTTDANRSFSIMLSDVNINGFSSVSYTQTESGVIFSGTPTVSLFTPLFRVCNDGTTVEDCKNSYAITGGECGFDQPCFCGAYNTYACDIICGDTGGQFYLLATGYSGFEEQTLVSHPRDFECPEMGLPTLQNILKTFKELHLVFSTQMYKYDLLLRTTTDPNLITEYTLQLNRYREALLIVEAHIEYIEDVLDLPTVTTVAEAIAKSEAVLAQLEALLGGGYSPTLLELTADLPTDVRFDRTLDIPFIITKTGGLPLYANLSLEVTDPYGWVNKTNSGCIDMRNINTHTHNLLFDVRYLGTWEVKAELLGSLKSNCDSGLRYALMTGFFNSNPLDNPTITQVSVPGSSVLNSTYADVQVSVDNPDMNDIYAKAVCTFTEPGGYSNSEESVCVRLYENTGTTFTINKLFDRAGTWTVTQCVVYASSNSDCTSSDLADTEIVNEDIEVILPSYIYLSAMDAPEQVMNNTDFSIAITANNPIGDRFIIVSYILRKPDGTEIPYVFNCTGLAHGDTAMFTSTMHADKVGAWNFNDVTIRSSTNADCSASVLEQETTGPMVDVQRNMNLTILSVGSLDTIRIDTMKVLNINVDNPLTTDRYGYVRCVGGTPTYRPFSNVSDCILFNKGQTETVNVNVYANAAGPWRVDSCSVYGSMNSQCSSATLNHVLAGIGSYNVVTSLEPYIVSAGMSAGSTMIGNNISVILDVLNLESSGKYVQAECTFVDPDGISTAHASSCESIGGNTNKMVALSMDPEKQGSWSVTSCSLNVSSSGNCASPSTSNSVLSVGTFTATLPDTVFISSLVVPGNVQNGTDMIINASVNNPLEDMYGRIECVVEDPDGINQTYPSTCVGMTSGTTTLMQVSVPTAKVGTWDVKECYIIGSPNPDCSSTRYHTLTGPLVNVIDTGDLTHVSITSVTAPTGDVANNTNVDIIVTVNNPIEDRYIIVDYVMEKPDGTQVTDTKACIGLSSGQTSSFTFTALINAVGTWTVSQASVRASTSAICSGATIHHTVTGSSFNAVASDKLSIVSVGPLTDIRTERTKMLNIPVMSPLSIDRYAKVTCTIRKPNLQSLSNVTSCEIVPAQGSYVFGLGVYVNSPGTWDILSCDVRSSLNSDCSSSTIQHTYSNIGSFDAYATLDPYIDSSQISPSSVRVGQTISVLLDVTNPDTDGKYVRASCRFRDPDLVYSDSVSSCSYVSSNSSETYTVSMTPEKIGTWNIPSCSLNVSTDSACLASLLRSTKSNIGSFSSTAPNSIYITSIHALSDVIKDTDAVITVSIRNPLEDVYARTRCRLQKPDGSTQTYQSTCSGIASGSTSSFQISALVDQIGLWNIAECFADASSSSDCSGAVEKHSTTGTSFNAVRGTNLTILSVSNLGRMKVNNTKTLVVSVRNPSTIDKQGTVTCSLSKPNTQTVTNTSSCARVRASSTHDFSVNAYGDNVGTWDVLSCYVRGTLNTDCSSSTIHDTISNPGSYDVVSEFNLTIRGSRIVDDNVYINNFLRTIIDVRNPDDVDKYATVECEFEAPNNVTYLNSSKCEWVERDHEISLEVNQFANITGTWHIRNCTLRASDNIACSPTRNHAEKEVIGPVLVKSPDLMITSIVTPQTSLSVGETAELKVYVKNYANSNRTTYVNCSIMDPTNRTHVLVTTNRVLIPDETTMFTPAMRVGVPGSWKVLSCAVYKIMSPATKEHEVSLNNLFSVLSPTPTECAIATDCAGTDDKCYCSDNSCMSCSSGTRCQNNECVSAIPPECITDTGCPAGHICQNERCVRKGECTYDAHCLAGYKCVNYNCALSGQCATDGDCEQGQICSDYNCVEEGVSWFDQNIVNFIIIILIIVLIPVLLFSYARRSI